MVELFAMDGWISLGPPLTCEELFWSRFVIIHFFEP